MPIKGIAFDLYGTLLDIDINRIRRSYTTFFKALSLSNKEIRSAFEIALIKNYTDLYQFAYHIKPHHNALIALTTLEKELREIISKISIFDDVLSMPQIMHSKNIRTIVISNAATLFKMPFYTLLSDFCNNAVFSCDFGKKKPHNDIFIEACNQMCLLPHEVMMVGDSYLSDYSGASKAGLIPMLLNRQSNSISQMNDINHINSLTQLPDLL